MTASKQVTVPLQCLQTVKSLISSCRRTGETILSNYWQNPQITATVHYFHYNSHHHYHYYHFYYHCKMHLYRLKILLTIPFIAIWFPVCFNWILSSFYWYLFFFYHILVTLGKKRTILANLLFYEIRQHLNIKIGFQAVKIYFLIFSSCFFTSYLQPIRNKLLKTSSIFYPTKGINTICRTGKIRPPSVFWAIA